MKTTNDPSKITGQSDKHKLSTEEKIAGRSIRQQEQQSKNQVNVPPVHENTQGETPGGGFIPDVEADDQARGPQKRNPQPSANNNSLDDASDIDNIESDDTPDDNFIPSVNEDEDAQIGTINGAGNKPGSTSTNNVTNTSTNSKEQGQESR